MDNVICFHLTNEPNGYLSNWYPSPFRLNYVTYTCAEQYLMHQKALMFGDRRRAGAILASEDPTAMRALGRTVVGYDDGVWTSARQLVAFRALKAKFSQNPILRERLEATGDAVIAECSVKDRIWGNGCAMDDPKRLDPVSWHGRNLLGLTLMLVRDDMRERFAGEERKMPLIHAFAGRLRHAAETQGEQGILCTITFEVMQALGFRLGHGSSRPGASIMYLGELPTLQLKYDRVDDPLVLGNAIFSEWRYYTHWAHEAMPEVVVRWFELAAQRLEEITGDKPEPLG